MAKSDIEAIIALLAIMGAILFVGLVFTALFKYVLS